MIRHSEVFSIGRLVKPHALWGELLFLFSDEVFDRTQSDFWMLEIDGILVPFFVESYRFRSGNTALVKFKGIDNELEARLLVDKEVYYPWSHADNQTPESAEPTWECYLGFEVWDLQNDRSVGRIKAVDQTTENVLFLVVDATNECLIPATEDFIQSKDMERKILYMSLPEGLVDIEQMP